MRICYYCLREDPNRFHNCDIIPLKPYIDKTPEELLDICELCNDCYEIRDHIFGKATPIKEDAIEEDTDMKNQQHAIELRMILNRQKPIESGPKKGIEAHTRLTRHQEYRKQLGRVHQVGK